MFKNISCSFVRGCQLNLARTCIVPNAAIQSRFQSSYSYETIKVTSPSEFVFTVSLNRVSKRNAMNKAMWTEVGDAFSRLGRDPDCRSIVLTGEGNHFSSGIDLADFMEIGAVVMGDDDVARKCGRLYETIGQFQDCFTRLEKCNKPIIGAISGACVGGAVDLLCATDIRYCSNDVFFQVKEVDLGLAADVGTLQRLPKILGSQSLVSELCFSARPMFAEEAKETGLVSRVFKDREATVVAAVAMATDIALKSPVAVQTTKRALVHAREHTVAEGLEFIRTLNSTYLQSQDALKATMALMQKEKATFDKL